MQRLVLQMQLNKSGWKTSSCLPLISWSAMETLPKRLRVLKVLISHYPDRSILWVQESVIFPLRSQINPFPSKFFKGFFPTISRTSLLLDCPVQRHEQNPFGHFCHLEEQPTLYYAMAEKNGQTFPPLILRKMWSSGLHSTQPGCYFYSHGLGHQRSFKFSSSGPHSFTLTASNHRQWSNYKINTRKNMHREEEKQHKVKPDRGSKEK